MIDNRIRYTLFVMGATLALSGCDPALDVGDEPAATTTSSTGVSGSSSGGDVASESGSPDVGGTTSGSGSPDPSGTSAVTGAGTGETSAGEGSTTADIPMPTGEPACCVHTGEVSDVTGPPGCAADPALEACVCAADPNCCASGWNDSCIELGEIQCGGSCFNDAGCGCSPLDPASCEAGAVCVQSTTPFLVCAIAGEPVAAPGEGCDSNYACEFGSMCAPVTAVPGCDPGPLGQSCCTSHCEVDGPDTCLPGQVCLPMFPDYPGCAGDNLGVCTTPGHEFWDQIEL
ncbi:MAG: hypothetical protein IPH07_21365 [Deltaproteobacteria bacterium]|nr:hypothetical protein [Deltaproteobacteria bacterium]MBK8714484.1 hypothetical protein [Deltaproteobacteria bacterium]MBP7288244.1 hypothetical protein [Nannocystaceae bacterium]